MHKEGLNIGGSVEKSSPLQPQLLVLFLSSAWSVVTSSLYDRNRKTLQNHKDQLSALSEDAYL